MQPSFMRRYPVASFYILALALGTAIVYLVAQGILPSSLALVAALSASIAGIIMTAVEDGRAGLQLMLRPFPQMEKGRSPAIASVGAAQ